MTLQISAAAYRKMLDDQGITVLDRQRRMLDAENAQLRERIKHNDWKITGLVSSICALQLCKDR